MLPVASRSRFAHAAPRSEAGRPAPEPAPPRRPARRTRGRCGRGRRGRGDRLLRRRVGDADDRGGRSTGRAPAALPRARLPHRRRSARPSPGPPRCTRTGRRRPRRPLFERHDSLEAKVGAALASWPGGSLDRLEQLGKLYPDEAVVQLNLGLARLWANRGDPTAAWRAAAEAEPDTPYAVLAGNVLYPKLPARASGVHPLVRRIVRGHTPAAGAPARRVAGRAPSAAASATGCCTESVSSASGGPCPRARRSSTRRAWRPRTPRRRWPPRSGAFDKDGPGDRLRAARPAHAEVPERAVRPLPPGRAPPLDGADRRGGSASSASPSRTRPGSPLAREAVRYLETIRKARS